jgi:hypothetical protein
MHDNRREAPIYRCVVAAMQDAAQIAEWGSHEYGRRFWRRVTRHAFHVHVYNTHQREGEPTVYERLPEIIAELREMCEQGERRRAAE